MSQHSTRSETREAWSRKQRSILAVAACSCRPQGSEFTRLSATAQQAGVAPHAPRPWPPTQRLSSHLSAQSPFLEPVQPVRALLSLRELRSCSRSRRETRKGSARSAQLTP
eukprot:Amastigsp_a175336_22.p4 type:complete len:111 gc:universal Amastigsp_a175336_22:1150-1482(+)